jgi:predicted DsbA family dithiol-disulfide isomerase
MIMFILPAREGLHWRRWYFSDLSLGGIPKPFFDSGFRSCRIISDISIEDYTMDQNAGFILEVFSDYVWPWCYFITGRVERLKEEYEIGIRWIAFPLHPETPEEGMSLEELFKGRGIDLPASMGRLEKVATELGLPWGRRTRTYNSRRAQELGKWAEASGQGDEFHMAVFHAYFADGRNIADISVLKEIVGKIGLDGRTAELVLAEKTFKEAVDHDWEYSRTCGITAVPTFMVDGRRVIGAQPYQALADLVTAAGGKIRDLTS